jgi:hypothetical protein
MVDFQNMVSGPLVTRYVVVRYDDRLYLIEEGKWKPP